MFLAVTYNLKLLLAELPSPIMPRLFDKTKIFTKLKQILEE